MIDHVALFHRGWLDGQGVVEETTLYQRGWVLEGLAPVVLPVAPAPAPVGGGRFWRNREEPDAPEPELEPEPEAPDIAEQLALVIGELADLRYSAEDREIVAAVIASKTATPTEKIALMLALLAESDDP